MFVEVVRKGENIFYLDESKFILSGFDQNNIQSVAQENDWIYKVIKFDGGSVMVWWMFSNAVYLRVHLHYSKGGSLQESASGTYDSFSSLKIGIQCARFWRTVTLPWVAA